jgi:heat shock protein HslJ
MMRWLYIPAVVAGLSAAAVAQEARKFPVGQTFKVVSISGFDVQNAGMTFTVSAEPQSNRLVGIGNAGCNTWSATVVLREDQLDIMTIATTRKMCSKTRMTTEEAFLTSLKSAQRWRIDEKGRLILEGEAARLLLTAAGAAKQPGKKPAK